MSNGPCKLCIDWSHCWANDACAKETLAPVTGSEKFATAKEDICGMVARIKKGETLKITLDDGETCTIERAVWQGSQVKLSNCIVGVPRRLLQFKIQNDQTENMDMTQGEAMRWANDFGMPVGEMDFSMFPPVSGSAPLIVGNTYRGRRTKEASNLRVYCDRRITYLSATLVQYDTPTRTGRFLPAMGREKFEAWVELDVTSETPKGGWAPYSPENPASSLKT